MARKKFDYIQHTADIGVVAYGGNLKEAYANAAYGMFSIITDLRKVRLIESREVELEENDAEALLFAWLNHLIYLFEVERILFKKCEIVTLTEGHLKAVCRGEKIDIQRHVLKLGVKAATYHQLRIDPVQNEVQVIFDI
jgi:SHS2 domain-containing protein